MSNVIPLPLIHDAMSDEEIEFHTSRSFGKLAAENAQLMIGKACAESWARSWHARLSAYQVRRLRFTIAGAVVGALVMAALDGSAAQKIDRLLTWLGWAS